MNSMNSIWFALSCYILYCSLVGGACFYYINKNNDKMVIRIFISHIIFIVGVIIAATLYHHA